MRFDLRPVFRLHRVGIAGLYGFDSLHLDGGGFELMSVTGGNEPIERGIEVGRQRRVRRMVLNTGEFQSAQPRNGQGRRLRGHEKPRRIKGVVDCTQE